MKNTQKLQQIAPKSVKYAVVSVQSGTFYTGQNLFTQALPVVPVTNMRCGSIWYELPWKREMKMGVPHLTLTPTRDFTWQGNRAGQLTWTGSTVSLCRWTQMRRRGREREKRTYLFCMSNFFLENLSIDSVDDDSDTCHKRWWWILVHLGYSRYDQMEQWLMKNWADSCSRIPVLASVVTRWC